MKQSIRTDLALECLNHFQNTDGQGREVEGVIYHRKTIQGISVHSMEILTEDASNNLCKPIGSYYTISLNKIIKRCDESFLNGVTCISEVLRSILPHGNKYLIACLGNPQITPDAIGPLSSRYLMVTRHLKAYMPDTFSDFSEVSLVSPGVLGTTGIESASLIKGAVDAVKPDVVLVVDALAAKDVSSLGAAIQISNTGIEPGSGVGNRRYALNTETLGVPVISIGVPTIVDLSTLLYSISHNVSNDTRYDHMFVTPQNIDTLVSDSAKLIAYGMNFALHPNLSLEDVDLFVS